MRGGGRDTLSGRAPLDPALYRGAHGPAMDPRRAGHPARIGECRVSRAAFKWEERQREVEVRVRRSGARACQWVAVRLSSICAERVLMTLAEKQVHDWIPHHLGIRSISLAI